MENLKLLNYSDITNVNYKYYSNGYYIQTLNSKLIITDIFNTSKKYEVENTLTSVTHFLAYEFFFILINENDIYIITKEACTLSPLGNINEKIHSITCNSKYTLILTDKNFMIFENEYFDLVKEIECDVSVKYVKWSSDDVFCAVLDSKIIFYNKDLEAISLLNLKVNDCVYLEEYNIWCMLCDQELCFVEDNGNVHDKNKYPLIFDNIEVLKVNCIEGKILLLYSKEYLSVLKKVDGKWQVKQNMLVSNYENVMILSTCKDNQEHNSAKISNNGTDTFVSIDVVNDKVIFQRQSSFALFFLFEEYMRFDNTFLVQDDDSLLVYNLEAKRCTLYDFKLIFKEPILEIRLIRNGLLVYLKSEIIAFDSKFNKIKHQINSEGGTNVLNAHMIRNESITVYKDGCISFKNQMLQFMPLIDKYQLDWAKDKLYILYEKKLYEQIKDITDNISHLTINEVRNKNSGIVGNFRLTKKNITSFYLTSDDILYTMDDKMYVSGSQIYVDYNFKILGTTDSEIFGYSRFSSIDTYNNKNFIRSQIKKLIEEGESAKAINMMINYNIKEDISNITIEGLTQKQVFYVIDEAVKDAYIMLDNDTHNIMKYFELKDGVYVCKDEYTNICVVSHKYFDLEKERDSIWDIQITCSQRSLISDILKEFKDNNKVIEYLLMKCKRADLAILYGRSNLTDCISLIRNYISIEDIKRSVIIAYGNIQNNQERKSMLMEVYRLINEDLQIIEDIESRYHTILELYKLFDELILYLLKNNMIGGLLNIITKYRLHKKILPYIKLSKNKELVNIYVEGVDYLERIEVYKYIGDNDRLLSEYIENNMYVEVFDFYNNLEEGNNNIIEINYAKKKAIDMLIDNMIRSKMFVELGLVYEKYLYDKDLALEYYVKGNSISDIYRLYKPGVNLLNVLDKQITEIDKLKYKLIKYKKRLQNIEQDICDDTLSVTSTCVSNRGMPGNLYEYEFYLERVNMLMLKINKWYRESKMCYEMTNNFELKLKMDDIKDVVKDIGKLFDFGYERSKEKIIFVGIEFE